MTNEEREQEIRKWERQDRRTDHRDLGALLLVVVLMLSGLGAGYWLVFVRGVHDYRRELAAEDRRSEAVGAKPLPKGPVVIKLEGRRNDCMAIEKAEFEGQDIWVNWRTMCSVEWAELHATQRGPDGTIIGTGYSYVLAGERVGSGERGEYKFSFGRILTDPFDPRTAIIELRIESR